jgi:hypothetical protein
MIFSGLRAYANKGLAVGGIPVRAGPVSELRFCEKVRYVEDILRIRIIRLQ